MRYNACAVINVISGTHVEKWNFVKYSLLNRIMLILQYWWTLKDRINRGAILSSVHFRIAHAHIRDTCEHSFRHCGKRSRRRSHVTLDLPKLIRATFSLYEINCNSSRSTRARSRCRLDHRSHFETRMRRVTAFRYFCLIKEKQYSRQLYRKL